MFNSVSSRANFAKQEEETLKYWQDNDIFNESVRQREGSPRFTLFEGPPTANGRPGIHHALSRSFKDVIPRYKTMKGYYAPRIGGWDTHGLPVELEVEKQLGFTSKKQIEDYSIAKFNKKCKASVFKYLEDWDKMTVRLGYWCDLDHPYVTMENEYIESGWWTMKQLWDKGYLYQGYRVTPHCPRCGTSLSSHELAQGYSDATDPAIFVKFKACKNTLPEEILKAAGETPVYFMAWTTTPWTIPSNVALAVSASDDYAAVKSDNEIIILAKERVTAVGLDPDCIAVTVKGSELTECRYEPIYNPHDFGIDRKKMTGDPSQSTPVLVLEPVDHELTYPVISTDYVTMDDGTGIVHTAPAFGEDDFASGRKYSLNFIQHVDLQGIITGSYPFAGKFVKTADPEIIEDLKQRGALYKSGSITHTYPFCWRCKTPLLYYAKQSWYIRTTAVKDKLVSGNKKINWVPEHIKEGRFGDWLENNVDWAVSRERYWGTPLPVWQCTTCGKQTCIGSIDELKNEEGVEGITEPLDLHRPYVDDITFKCHSCGGQMKRVKEVIDCWFDSGNMQIAQYHYPFNESSKTIFNDGRYPADFICEAVDQTRGWFYSLHALSTLLFGEPCFKNVICLGHILDEKGEKMSKSRGNVVDVMTVLNKYGADATRWYLFTSGPPGNARRFSEQLVADVTRQFMLILWNVYSFFITYANIDNFDPTKTEFVAPTAELDKWLVSETHNLVKVVTEELDTYDITSAARAIESFVVDDLSNWYVRRSRRRFWKSENDNDKISAYFALYNCLVTVSKLLAPFMPFLADELYRNLVISVDPNAKKSVHLTDFPVCDESLIDESIEKRIRLAIKLSSLGRAARSAAGVKVRQPMATAYIKLASSAEADTIPYIKDQLMEELNIKDVTLITDETAYQSENYIQSVDGPYTIFVDKNISQDLLDEGIVREIVHRMQNIRKAAGLEIADHIKLYCYGDEYIAKVYKDFADYIRHETLADELNGDNVPEGVTPESYNLDGHVVNIAVVKV